MAPKTGNSPAPFLTKTYQLVDNPAVDDLISWSENGETFIVWQPEEFARDLLPENFKHNNFRSFVRQLNTYGFRKVAPDRWEFANDFFRKDDKTLLRNIQPKNALLRNIQRRKTTSLLEENERLKKENMEMSQELSQLRGLFNNILSQLRGLFNINNILSPMQELSRLSRLFNNILSLMVNVSHHSDSAGAPEGQAEDCAGPATAAVTLRLFGVSIGGEWQRVEENSNGNNTTSNGGDEEMQEADPAAQGPPDEHEPLEVKSEPLEVKSEPLEVELKSKQLHKFI